MFRFEEFIGGNGLVEMGILMLILIGMISGGIIFILVGSYGLVVVVIVVIVLVVVGNVIVWMIFKVDVGVFDFRINWNLLFELLVVLCLVRK